MKKGKKILSSLLAAAMVAAMSIFPVSAAETAGLQGDGNTAVTTLPFTKYVTVDENATIPDMTFTFTMEPVDPDGATVDGQTVLKGVGSATTTVEFKTKEDKTITDEKISKTGSFNLPDMSNQAAGIYRYKVTETAGSETDKQSTYVTYSTEEYYVDLYVMAMKDASGTTKNAIGFVQARDKDFNKAPIVFTNALTLHSICIKKEIVGLIDADQEFTFYVKIPVGGVALDLTKGTVMTAYKTDRSGNKTTVTNIIVGGEQNDNEGWCEFKLKGGESLTIDNVPVGMIYHVKEDAVNGITTTYKVVSNGSTEEGVTAQSGNDAGWQTVSNATNEVIFINTKNVTNTGIVLDVLPYVVVLLIAACGVVLYTVKKSRSAK
jgi:hypothetical protein